MQNENTPEPKAIPPIALKTKFNRVPLRTGPPTTLHCQLTEEFEMLPGWFVPPVTRYGK